MKHLSTYIFILLFFLPSMLFAQRDSTIVVHDDSLNTDETIGLPEGMLSNVDSLLLLWNSKQYIFPQAPTDQPTYISAFSSADYEQRLSRIPAIIEMPYNNVVHKFIEQYTGRLNKTISFCLSAGNFYIPMFEEALDYYQLPLELKYLPIIESALNPTARSKAGAVGLWQFMLNTGKRYGLEVNSLVDERRDPIKSTWAAAQYLKDLYDIYKDWTLVIAAYNYGPGNVNKAIHRADGIADYWKIYPYLPTETRGYVPAFIAVNYAMQFYCDHHITPMETKYPNATDTVMISQKLHFKQIAELCDIDIEAIRALNPQYLKDIIPGETRPYTLRLPQEKILAFVDVEDSIYEHRANELFKRRAKVEVDEGKKATSTSPKTVRVRRGDNLGTIARRYGTTVAKIKRLNGLKNSNIRAGQRLRIK
ncbi:MAG: transglycosylase SLT domain-containing protein [Bacteroidaceae bacterium]|nr:transglycosylase SLT domain-containing protein [Bacteroidaceae bacterium]